MVAAGVGERCHEREISERLWQMEKEKERGALDLK